jgi:hypothetical protein
MVLDLMVHDFDFTRWLAGEMIRIRLVNPNLIWETNFWLERTLHNTRTWAVGARLGRPLQPLGLDPASHSPPTAPP